VVALVEIRGPNHSLVHPRGTVGIITRTPCGTDRHFLVRFPDGFEASLSFEQLEVLKLFKDRLGRDSVSPSSTIETAPSGPSRFDLEPLIIYRCIVGSRAYGLDTDESDTDIRGIYLAPANLQWSLFGAPEQFEDNDTQSCYWELQKFLIMALKANPNILECLYSPMIEKIKPLEMDIVSHDVKQIPDLVARKQSGENISIEDADLAFHQREYERLRTELQAAHDASPLPELPSDETRAALNDLLIRVRLMGRCL